jgi:hypothetical protein
MSWIQDKALDLVDFTGTVTQAIPELPVGSSPVPLLVVRTAASPLPWTAAGPRRGRARRGGAHQDGGRRG